MKANKESHPLIWEAQQMEGWEKKYPTLNKMDMDYLEQTLQNMTKYGEETEDKDSLPMALHQLEYDFR